MTLGGENIRNLQNKKDHQGSVKCIEKVDRNVLASGGRDGKIILYDLRQKNSIGEYIFS